MKRFLKTPVCLAIFASWALGLTAHSQTNTNTYFAQLGEMNRTDASIHGNNVPSAFANRDDVARFGDDGSAAIVDASGSIVWRTAAGNYYVLPKGPPPPADAAGVVPTKWSDAQAAKPLFVSNTQCIVWANAYEPDPTLRTNIVLNFFYLNNSKLEFATPAVIVNGNKVLETPVISTSTMPYTLVTANVTGLPASTNIIANQNIFVYRMSNNEASIPQLLSIKKWINTTEFLYSVDSVAVAADGTQMVRVVDPFLVLETFWDGAAWIQVTPSSVDTAYIWIRNDGSIQDVFHDADPFVVANNASAPAPVPPALYGLGTFTNGAFIGTDAAPVYPALTPISVSATQFVFGSNVVNGAVWPIANLAVYGWYGTGNVVAQTPITTLPPGTQVVNTPPYPHFNEKGVVPIFVTQQPTVKTASVYRLDGVTATLLYAATLPSALGPDSSVSRLNLTPGSESAMIRDTNNGGMIWLHFGPGTNQLTGVATTNFSLINELHGYPVFVTPGEAIIWNNALSAVQPSGLLPPVVVNHYGRDGTGTITTAAVSVLYDATEPFALYPSALRGTQVFTPYPFTRDPDLWKLETSEKFGNNVLRIRNYELLRPEYIDEDGDGIPGLWETGPFYIIPGKFTYDEAVADAKLRGGHLATFDTAAEYASMQASISLWQRNSPLALPKRDVPYPLWIGLELDAPNPWSWSAETLETPAPVVDGTLAAHWAPGEPSGVASRIRAQMNSHQQWEAVSPGAHGCYLLELTATDPLAVDTDGDDVSDYDELFRLHTDPTVPNFGAGTPAPVTFTLASGNYEGFLTGLGKGPLAGFILSVTNKGAYTGRIYGASGNATIRGSFAADGSVISLPVNFGAGLVTNLSMLIAPDPVTGIFRVGGKMAGLNGEPLAFELRRPLYSKIYPTPSVGLYTVTIPADPRGREGQPAGDGYLTGNIGADGRAALRGLSSDGQALSWSGNVLEGEMLSFFAMIGKTQGFVGSNLFLRSAAELDTLNGLIGQSDLDGDLLVTRSPLIQGATQTAGYGFRSQAYGAVYRPVRYDQLPSFYNFKAQPNNAVMQFTDGVFDGQRVIVTWSTKNAITTPATQTRTLSAKIDTKTGLLSGTYRYNDPNMGYAASKGVFYGVSCRNPARFAGCTGAG